MTLMSELMSIWLGHSGHADGGDAGADTNRQANPACQAAGCAAAGRSTLAALTPSGMPADAPLTWIIERHGAPKRAAEDPSSASGAAAGLHNPS